jgi:hypothetical protein
MESPSYDELCNGIQATRNNNIINKTSNKINIKLFSSNRCLSIQQNQCRHVLKIEVPASTEIPTKAVT